MLRGSVVTLVGKISYAGLSYVGLAMATRMLGPDQFGLFALGLTTVILLQTVATMGVDNTLLRLIPARLATAPEQALPAMRSAWQLVLLGSGLCGGLLVLFRVPVAVALGQPAVAPILAALAFSIPCAAALSVLRAASQSVHAISEAVLTTLVLQIVLQVVAYTLLFLGSGRPEATLAAGAYSASWVLATCIAIPVVARHREFGWSWLRPGVAVDRDVGRMSFRFLLIQVLVNLKSSVVIFVVGHTLARSDIGLYAASLRIASFVSFVLVGVNMGFAPMISGLWARGDRAELSRLYGQTVRWTLVASLPVCILLITAAPGILTVFDPTYRRGAAVLALLAVGQLINAGTGSVGYLLMMTGHEATVLWNTVAVTVVAAVASWWASSAFGIVGAAVVGGLVIGGFNLLLLWNVWSRLRLLPYSVATLRTLVVGLASLGCGLLVYRHAWRPESSQLLGLLEVGGVVLGSYLIFFLLWGLTPEDRAFLRDLTRRGWSRLRNEATAVETEPLHPL